MFTFIITYTTLIYLSCMIGVAFTTWHLGMREGGKRTVLYLVEEGYLEAEEVFEAGEE